jgi:serine phosphatase RsbU (regulator of sigma subunit)/PAS domain-containing protein
MSRKLVTLLFLTVFVSATSVMCVVGLRGLVSVRHLLNRQIETVERGLEISVKAFQTILLSEKSRLDAELDRKLPELAGRIAELERAGSATRAQLETLAYHYGVDQIYLIGRDKVVYQTTFEPDLNFNLGRVSEALSRELDEVFKSSEPIGEPFAVSTKTGQMNSYRYYHPPGTDFIVEVSVGLIHYIGANRSVEFNSFVFNNIFSTLGGKDSIVIDVDVFFVTDAVRWSLLRPGLTLEDEAVTALKQADRLEVRDGNTLVIYSKIPFSYRQLFRDANFVGRYVIDLKERHDYIVDTLLYGAAAVVSVLLFVFVAALLFFRRTVLNRILAIAQGVGQLGEGDLSHRIRDHGNDEIKTIADAINDMAQKVKERERRIAEINAGLEQTVRERTSELGARTNLLQAILRSMNEGVVAFDRDLKLAAWNADYLRLRRYPPELGRAGEPFETFVKIDVERGEFGTDDPVEARRKIMATVQNSKQHSFERQRPDGTWLEVRGGPIEGGGFVSTYTDITDRKRAEEELMLAYSVIRESVDYASQIQRSLLPEESELNELGENFVIWLPRDVVGGDFYWARKSTAGDLVVVGDGTGHGVPGAFMTLIATSALNEALAHQPDGDPALLLQVMNRYVRDMLRQYEGQGVADDGMELGICRIERGAGRLTFAGARFSLVTLRDGKAREIKGDRTGIGYRRVADDTKFSDHEIEIKPDDVIYLATDGIVDQIGGPRRRAFGKKRLLALLEKHAGRPMAAQRAALMAVLNAYQADEPRRDDVTVVGLRVRAVNAESASADEA